jgi:tRNA A-37 threonylcarbamoyl transferase component Bud32/dienelactone hydrolase
MTDALQRLWNSLADRYEVDREIGHGGMASVYLARDIKHGRAVAVKVMRPELAQAVGGERFLREINIAAQLQSPHILPLLDSGEVDGLLFYVMPYVEGDSLRGRLVRDGALPPSEAMRLFHDIVDGVAHAHRHGVVHRDLKPDNVMIAERHALVVDFGVAKAMRDASQHDLTSIGISLGTPAYMAPEQAAADPNTDQRADIYALGVIAYEMLTGQPPFTGAPQAVLAAHITAAPPPLLEARPDLPPAIAQLVMRCLEKDPAARFQTADELLLAVESLQTPVPVPMGGTVRGRRGARFVVPAAVAALAAVAWFGTGKLRSERWVHETAIPEIVRLADAQQNDSAYALAARAAAILPGDSLLKSLLPRFTRRAVIHSKPEGAKVYRASLDDTTHWTVIGTTPTDTVQMPSGAARFRMEKPGFQTFDGIAGGRGGLAVPVIHLASTTSGHPEMALVTGGRFAPFLVGLETAKPLELGDFLMDKYEVTNREYKAFVDAGGYAKRDFWEPVIVSGGHRLTWEETMARFRDKTGRPGPATWEGGDFPTGQADVAVGGVAWYEAAAYAKFAGKSLPTVYHWSRAAHVQDSRYIVPSSNLVGSAPAPKNVPRGRSAFGVFDLAGNVREWCENATDDPDQRFILGGGWSDPVDAFVDAYAQPALDRSVINGIRLVRYLDSDPNVALASRPRQRGFRDYSRETPVSDAVFQSLRLIYDYDHTPLRAKVDSRDTTSDQWDVERVSFDAAYGNERVSLWVFLPKHAKPPLQTVVYVPGGGAISSPSSLRGRDMGASFVVKSGRAFVLPIYKGTYERQDSLPSDVSDSTIRWRDHVVMWGKDYRRTLDYLSTRPDVDSTKFAYFGFSWGGNLGGLIPAIEPRIKTVILYVAGLEMTHIRPEVDPFNFLPHIKVPTLMLNGKYDFFFPIETAQKPFFRLLGTPADQKKYVVYEGGHDVPRMQLISESFAWLDKYLGPVR